MKPIKATREPECPRSSIIGQPASRAPELFVRVWKLERGVVVESRTVRP